MSHARMRLSKRQSRMPKKCRMKKANLFAH
jgi:hypothetical protein